MRRTLRIRTMFLTPCLAFLLGGVGAATATMIVPMDPEHLAASSEVVVVGSVAQIRHAELANGRIVTLVTIDLDEVWKGPPSSPFEIVERGGIVADRGEVIYGSPSYSLGEPVLVFASRTRLGWQTNHMMQGKFRIHHNADGTRSARRQVEPGVSVLSSAARPWRSDIPLAELRAITEASAGRSAPGILSSPAQPRDVGGGIADDVVYEVTSEFTTQPMNPRFFGADTGQSLVFVIDDRGDDILGLEVSRRAVDSAFAAWNAISGTSLELVDGGLTDDISTDPVDGLHKVLFNDPGDEIFDPSDCSGTLGFGGSQFTPSETKSFNSTTFLMILSAEITFADNWEGCPQWTECNLSEVAAHEGGHAFGLGHSSDNPNEGNIVRRDALMYFRAHFDGRCAAPREDDVGGIRFIYPAPAPLTITTASQLPEAVATQPYSVQLEFTAADEPVTWSRTGACDAADGGLDLTSSGLVEGPLDNVVGNGCLEVVATDATGNSHQKRFGIDFVDRPSSPTQTPSGIPPTPTVPADRPCVGDCNGNDAISINELIRGVNIALGFTDVSACRSFDRNGDGQVAINELIQAVQAALGGCTGT